MDDLDQDMLKNLDVLLDLDILEEENDWETVEEIDQVSGEANEAEEGS